MSSDLEIQHVRLRSATFRDADADAGERAALAERATFLAAEERVARLRSRRHVTDAALALADATSAAIVAELLHGPSVALRHGATDAAVVRRLFRLDR